MLVDTGVSGEKVREMEALCEANKELLEAVPELTRRARPRKCTSRRHIPQGSGGNGCEHIHITSGALPQPPPLLTPFLAKSSKMVAKKK